MLAELRGELKGHVDSQYLEGAKNYFREEINIYGVRLPEVRALSSRYFGTVKAMGKTEIFAICEELLESGFGEEATIAFDWAFRLRKEYAVADFEKFELWLENHVSNWSLCDDFSSHAFGYLVFRYPELLDRTLSWCGSENRWLRRASAVISIYPVRKGNILQHIFTVCDSLIGDEDDLVRKGYGWLLKEASNRYPDEVFEYVMERRDRLPRVALRYAIEKYPPEMRKRAMEK